MTRTPYDFQRDGRSTVASSEAPGEKRIAGSPPASSHRTTERWTAAHREAARFIGGCFAAGAVLGAVVQVARPARGQGHG